MIFAQLIPINWHGIFIFILLLTLFKIAVNKFRGGLAHIPGPWLASCSDLWRLCVVWGRRPEVTHIQLHEKYGPIVRIGPRAVSVGDPEAIKIIYGPNSGFIKVRPKEEKTL